MGQSAVGARCGIFYVVLNDLCADVAIALQQPLEPGLTQRDYLLRSGIGQASIGYWGLPSK
ncbi:hypothetical protein I8748_00370 [Nostoc sp. CENA67]|uniref:Uncharacterized protein n=1 Tax=Amazonocrinis nigriterrae CENA67 TaxID=2794033 RepID=A0A8J7L8S6_9NOST|nr:hypothetical protein [Amazonocrinis nigriterrae]MBH8560676.1 hypothetical protein [Amazonocrinis nigriterrae CENA67]